MTAEAHREPRLNLGVASADQPRAQPSSCSNGHSKLNCQIQRRRTPGIFSWVGAARVVHPLTCAFFAQNASRKTYALAALEL